MLLSLFYCLYYSYNSLVNRFFFTFSNFVGACQSECKRFKETHQRTQSKDVCKTVGYILTGSYAKHHGSFIQDGHKIQKCFGKNEQN